MRFSRAAFPLVAVLLFARPAFADTASELVQRLLDHTVGLLGGAGTLPCQLVATTSGRTLAIGSGGPTLTGADHALRAWLLRRSDGAGLAVAAGESLPAVPSLG